MPAPPQPMPAGQGLRRFSNIPMFMSPDDVWEDHPRQWAML